MIAIKSAAFFERPYLRAAGISNRDVGTSDSSLSRVLNPYEFGYRHLALIA
jgi:hypothetical protein